MIALVGTLLLTGSEDPEDTEDSESQAIDAPTPEPAATSTPESEESPATATPVLSLDSRDPLEWEGPMPIGELWPLAVVDYEDELYLFGTPRGPWSDGSGLDTWVSVDGGTTWDPLGTVIQAPNLITAVVGTDRGLLALGTDGTTGTPTVWQSEDGGSWESSSLPLDEPVTPGSPVRLQTAVTTDDLTVVFGSAEPDIGALIRDALPEDLGVRDGIGYGFGMSAPPLKVTVQGPLGLTVFSASGEELGLTEDQEALLIGEPTDNTTVWSSSDGTNWQTSQIYAMNVNAAFISPDGVITAFGYGFQGEATWLSTTGTEWERQSGGSAAEMVTSWNDLLLGTRQRGRNAELMSSDDGDTWISFGVNELLDKSLSWHFYPIAAGPAGVAAIARGYAEPRFEREPEPFVMERDGYTVTLNGMQSLLTLSQGESEVLLVPLQDEQVDDEVDVDFVERTITFLDPATGADLVTFTFDEIETAQAATSGAMGPDFEHVLMFSPDGSAWSVQPIEGRQAEPQRLHVTDDAVVMVTVTDVEPFSRSSPSPMVHIWVAPVS